MKKTIATVLISAAVIIGGVLALPSKSMNVDGVACSSFASCGSLADAGSVWTISGDWRSAGKLSVPNNSIIIRGDNAIISYITTAGNDVEFYGFEVTGSPAGINGIFWTGERGYIHDNYCHDAGLTCIRLYTSFDTVVDNNIVGDNRRGVAGNSDGINCSGGGRATITNNETYNNGDDGMDTWTCPDSVVRYNYAHDNCGGGDENGFKLGPGNGALVEYNKASYNCSAGFASNEGANIYKYNTANNNKIGFSDWCGAGCVRIREYYYNVAYNNGVNFNIKIPSQWLVFVGNSTTPPVNATQTASSTPPVPTLTISPTKTNTPVPATVTSTATPSPECILFPVHNQVVCLK